MAKAVEEISDGLEIISIGKLYSGPWEKKYWSCSRGKDRYPYPFGFKAVRTQNGITFRMEILEGHKGPLFTISSSDGLSSSGQTPDIAWESFQKKGSSQIKLLRGKRFSCKIDGLEFFGFKNGFVQRLLRQLVANIDGPAERCFNQSAIGNEVLGIEDPVQQTDFSIAPDVLPYKEKPRLKLNRSRKEKIISSASGSSTSLKVVHSKHGGHTAVTFKNGSSCQGIQSNCVVSTIPISKEDQDFVKCAGAGQKAENSQPEIEERNLLVCAKDDFELNLNDTSNNLIFESASAQEESKLASFGGSSALVKEVNSSKRKELFDCSMTQIEDKEVMANNNMEATDDSELCAPDTFDHPQGEVIVAEMAVSKGLVTETHLEDDSCTSNSYPSSEKPDSDSVDQEIAKSMMTVLLPRAIPLLKTFSRRKKKNKSPSKNSATGISNEESNPADNGPFPGREIKETMGLSESNKQPCVCDVSYECMEHLEPVVLDNFDNGGNEDPLKKKLPAFHDVHLADQLLVVPDTYQSQTILDMQLEASGGPIEATHGSSYPADSCTGNCEAYVMKELPDDKVLADFNMSTLPVQVQKMNPDEIADKEEGEDGPNLNNHIKKEKKNKLENVLKLVACYDHPLPVSIVLLSTIENNVYLCILCGVPLQGDKTLFLYKAPISGKDVGSPSFVGYSPAIFPFSKDAFGRMIPVDSSGLQFTPDAQSLVLLNSIKVACCRKGNIFCTCQACSSLCFQEDAIKIVRVEAGYVSMVTRLKTTQAVRCILVCEPNYLVAADESAQVCLWVMNSSWSAQIDECYLPVPEVMFPCMVELKKIPTSEALVVAHNGHGEFNLWDIKRRILVSKFSIPDTYVAKCLPIGWFQWHGEGGLFTELKPEEFTSKVLDATKMWVSGTRKSKLPQTESQDVAIWLLVSTISDSEFQDCRQSVDGQNNPVQCWRLALLIKEMVIVGASLDAGAGAIGAADGLGIMGRKDGLVYLWELSTGIKKRTLHQFKGSGVSCIATDSSCGTLAVASDSGQLLVYKPF